MKMRVEVTVDTICVLSCLTKKTKVKIKSSCSQLRIKPLSCMWKWKIKPCFWSTVQYVGEGDMLKATLLEWKYLPGKAW